MKPFLLFALLAGTLAVSRAEERGDFWWEIQAVEMTPLAETWEEREAGSLMWLRRGGAVSGAGYNEVPMRSLATIPKAGSYVLWVRYEVHPARRKTFSVEIQGQQLPFATESFGSDDSEHPEIYQGRKPEKRMIWTRHVLDLSPGEHEVILSATCEPPLGRWTEEGHPPVVETLLLTNDFSFDPAVQ